MSLTDARIIIVLALLGAGVVLSRFRKAEIIVRCVTQFLTLVIVPLLLYLDCASLQISKTLAQLLVMSLVHVFLIYAIADVAISRVGLFPERKAAAILAACLPNVVYLPYSIYAVFGLDTAPLVPYVIAANILLPVVLTRVQFVARPGRRIRVKDLLATILISVGIGTGLVTAIVAPQVGTTSIIFRARRVLSCLMLLAFLVLGYEMAKIRTITRDVVYPLIFKIILSPTLMIVMLHLTSINLTIDYARGLLIESLTPTAIATVLYSKLLDFDTVYAATVVSITTLIALPTMLALIYSTISTP